MTVYLNSDHLRTALGSGVLSDPQDFMFLILVVMAENLSAIAAIFKPETWNQYFYREINIGREVLYYFLTTIMKARN